MGVARWPKEVNVNIRKRQDGRSSACQLLHSKKGASKNICMCVTCYPLRGPLTLLGLWPGCVVYKDINAEYMAEAWLPHPTADGALQFQASLWEPRVVQGANQC